MWAQKLLWRAIRSECCGQNFTSFVNTLFHSYYNLYTITYSPLHSSSTLTHLCLVLFRSLLVCVSTWNRKKTFFLRKKNFVRKRKPYRWLYTFFLLLHPFDDFVFRIVSGEYPNLEFIFVSYILSIDKGLKILLTVFFSSANREWIQQQHDKSVSTIYGVRLYDNNNTLRWQSFHSVS